MPFHPAPTLTLPPPLDGYRLIERIGRGGFGEVWRCEAPGGFQKAVKFVFGDLDSSDEGRPAEQELKSLNRVKDVRHPYILTLERYDIIDGQLMVVMELAERNLWDKFRECRMLGQIGVSRAELLGYLTEAAEALDLMNDRYKLQHLDIKPQNLFLVYNHIKVADFGLAKMFEGAVASVTGGVTPVYAAPETFQGEVSRFSDQYSLAIVYQELLTGVRPFNGANTKQLLLQHLREPPDLSALPEYDRPIIARALEKEPSRRWPSCRDMVQRLVAAPHTVTRADAMALPLPVEPVGGRTTSPADSFAPPTQAVYTQSAATGVAPTDRGTQTLPGPIAQAPSALTPAPPSPQGRPSWGTLTALPGLVTPRMVTATPRGSVTPRGGPTKSTTAEAPPNVTQARPVVVETGRMGALGIAPPERTGDGLLFPALVVGLGRTGLECLRAVRQIVHDRFDSVARLPTLRFLFIDTDPDETTAAAGSGADPLPPHQVLLARLKRPVHYLQREGLPDVQQWLPPNTLYQLPKASGPAGGVRCFGRLALCDHYRMIAQRIRQEVEPFLNDDLLSKTAEGTGLGVRSNRPRVYLLASLGGGTGGGMFLDLAYLLKHEMRNVGYRQPEVHGLFLVPPADKSTPRQAAANAFAALSELSHYTASPYKTRFDNSEPPLVDPTPPFDRVGLVQWPKKGTDKDHRRLIGAVARATCLDLFTPAGRKIDYVREVAPTDRYAGPTVQPFGVFRLSWPRYELLTTIARRMCQQVLRRWAAKDDGAFKEPIRCWLDEQWTSYHLDAGSILARLRAEVEEALRGSPDAAFDAAIDTLGPPGGKVDGNAAINCLDQLIKIVGKPDAEGSCGPATFRGFVDAAAQKILGELENRLSVAAVGFIERSEYRLAGADEALSQIAERLNDAGERLQDEWKRREHEAHVTFSKLFPLIGTLAGAGFALVGRRASVTQELTALLRDYPRQRYRAIALAAAVSLFRKLRDGLPEYTRDVGFCRARLTELADQMAAAPTTDTDAEPGAYVLPVGCPDLAAAADRFIAELPADEVQAFDTSLQADLDRKFRGLVNVCLKADRLPRFRDLLAAATRGFVDARLGQADPAEALARYRGTGSDCLNVLEEAYTAAAPPLTPVSRPAVEATILAAPDGPAGDQLRRLVGEANPDVEFIPASLPDDLVVYREYPRVAIGDLPQLGDLPRAAFDAAAGTDKPAYSRTDVDWIAAARPTAG
jgi:serine/threonine protein kinase